MGTVPVADAIAGFAVALSAIVLKATCKRIYELNKWLSKRHRNQCDILGV